MSEDDRKEQRLYKTQLIKSILEMLCSMLKNNRIRPVSMDETTIDILIDTFLWSAKHKEANSDQENKEPEKDISNAIISKLTNQPSKHDLDSKFLKQFESIYDIMIQILCILCSIKPSKTFISSSQVHEMDKMKKKAISHGVLALLYDVYENYKTDNNTKRFINAKVLHDAGIKDLQNQVKVIKEFLNPPECK